MAKNIPSLYEWIGGAEPLQHQIDRFYQKIPADPILAPVFAHMSPEHFQHVAQFIAEVLGGPSDYSTYHGGHAEMIRHHLNRHIIDQQRQRWMYLLLETADELRLPSDPEFRSALVAYLEWGSRLAVYQFRPPCRGFCYRLSYACLELGCPRWPLPAHIGRGIV